jgi:hypothetical protein
MQVHWQEKWLASPYKGQLTVLQGLPTSTPKHMLLHIDAMDMVEGAELEQMPLLVELRSLLEDYADLFQTPTSLPPSRACDHEIPLMPGAAPVFVRPYWYPPS